MIRHISLLRVKKSLSLLYYHQRYVFSIRSSYHTEYVFPVALWGGDNEGKRKIVKMSMYLRNVPLNQYDTQISSATVMIVAIDVGK